MWGIVISFCVYFVGFLLIEIYRHRRKERKIANEPTPPPLTTYDFLDVTFENGIYSVCVKESKHFAVNSIYSLIPVSRGITDGWYGCIVQKGERIANIHTSSSRSFEFTSPSKGVCKMPMYLSVGNKPLFEINTNEEYIRDFELKIAQRREQQQQESEQRRQQEEQRRREEERLQIAARLREKERRRKLEKQVLQELIDSGEVLPAAGRAPIPRDIVDAVYARDGGRCVYCGSMENLHIDHIIPFSKGGACTIENFQVLCQKCNLEKSNKIG